MIFRSRAFRKSLACLGLILSVAAGQAADPSAQEILEAARINPMGQKIGLNAQLRSGSTKTPFTITVDGAVRYTFENPDQELILELKEDGPSLTERVGGKTAPIRAARYDERVRNSGLTYEDIALRFLYWKNPKLLGDERIPLGMAWKIEVQAPRGQSQYGVARLWINKDSGALVKVEGYDMNGRLIRRFAVNSVKKIGDQWTLDQMRIEVLDPETKKVTNRSYLEVLGKKE